MVFDPTHPKAQDYREAQLDAEAEKNPARVRKPMTPTRAATTEASDDLHEPHRHRAGV
jgi:hypothetical protein